MSDIVAADSRSDAATAERAAERLWARGGVASVDGNSCVAEQGKFPSAVSRWYTC
jgi:hypothetical protein